MTISFLFLQISPIRLTFLYPDLVGSDGFSFRCNLTKRQRFRKGYRNSLLFCLEIAPK